jgi:hypothetical protein
MLDTNTTRGVYVVVPEARNLGARSLALRKGPKWFVAI